MSGQRTMPLEETLNSFLWEISKRKVQLMLLMPFKDDQPFHFFFVVSASQKNSFCLIPWGLGLSPLLLSIIFERVFTHFSIECIIDYMQKSLIVKNCTHSEKSFNLFKISSDVVDWLRWLNRHILRAIYIFRDKFANQRPTRSTGFVVDATSRNFFLLK